MKKEKFQKLFSIALFLTGALIFLGFILYPKYKFSSYLKTLQKDPNFNGGTISIAAQFEGSENPFFELNAEKRIHPGSNFKLFTAAASLAHLKPEFIFSTKLFLQKNGKDFLIVGSGDPSLKLKDVQNIAAEVKKFGYKTGNLYYNDQVFDGEKFGPGWGQDWKDLYFSVPITGLQINDNLMDIRGRKEEKTGQFRVQTAPLKNYQPLVDSMNYFQKPDLLQKPVSASMAENGAILLRGDTMPRLPFWTSATMRDPSRMTAMVFKQEFVSAGLLSPSAKVLPLEGERGEEGERGKLLYEYHSPPLQDLIFDMLKFSKNNYAETLVRTLGKELKGEGSQKKGVEVLEDFFDEVGISPDEVLAFDGSGLSPSTRVTSRAILQLFNYVNEQPWKDIFWRSLPQSQVDGTLKHRFENAGLKNPVIAKTGTHEFSSSLSGKILRDKKPILFSVHIYNHPFSTEETPEHVIPIIDKIVAKLENLP